MHDEQPTTSFDLRLDCDYDSTSNSSNIIISGEKSADEESYNFEGCTIPDYDEINEHELSIDNEEDTTELSGYRIVDIKYLLGQAMPLQALHNKICKDGKLLSLKEKRKCGLVSMLTYACNECSKEYSFETENPKQPLINTAAVWGTVSTDSTHAHLQEFLSVLDVPAMGANLFFNTQRKLGELWKESLWEVMESAGAEERRLAVENNQLDKDGIPYISVFLDGGWSKRSYGHSYNAASGVGVIIGEATSKVLFVGVRNKYCSICARAENRNEEAKSHICFKNWTGASTSMEQDIIVEGFNNSILMHGIRYKKIIADGDSTVLSRIRQKVKYGPEVAKVECSNHVMKNYRKALYQIKKNTRTVPLEIRKVLTKDIIENLVDAAVSAIYANAHGDIANLKFDLRNSVYHV